MAVAISLGPKAPSSAAPAPSKAEKIVRGYWQKVFDREPTASQLAEWVGYWNTRTSTTSFTSKLLNTNGAKIEWIRGIYFRYLDSNGEQSWPYWLTYMNNGHSRDDVTAFVLGSLGYIHRITPYSSSQSSKPVIARTWTDLTGDQVNADVMHRYYDIYSSGGQPVGPAWLPARMEREVEARRALVDRTYRRWLSRGPSSYALYRRTADLRANTLSGVQLEAEVMAAPELIARLSA